MEEKESFAVTGPCHLLDANVHCLVKKVKFGIHGRDTDII